MRRKVNALTKMLKENNLTIAFAESMTCGLASHQLTTVKGASEILRGGIICYQEKVKCELLSVSSQLIKKFSAESKQVTDVLAKNLSGIFEADVYAAITGLAAPGGSESKSKPVGTVFFSVVFRKKLYHEKKRFHGTPLEIKKKACEGLYGFIVTILKREIK
jgi:nicotinamide-nucleotide amidase